MVLAGALKICYLLQPKAHNSGYTIPFHVWAQVGAQKLNYSCVKSGSAFGSAPMLAFIICFYNLKYLAPPRPFQIKEIDKLCVHLMTLQDLQKALLTTLGKDARKNMAKPDYLMWPNNYILSIQRNIHRQYKYNYFFPPYNPLQIWPCG